MYRTATAITAGCVAALAFVAPTPALATTAVPAIHNGDAGVVQEVAKTDKKWSKKWSKYDRYAYGDSPRYRAYRYDDRRYAYDYDDDYNYDSPRRRSGVNLHFDF